jgi:hypothetical protein
VTTSAALVSVRNDATTISNASAVAGVTSRAEGLGVAGEAGKMVAGGGNTGAAGGAPETTPLDLCGGAGVSTTRLSALARG